MFGCKRIQGEALVWGSSPLALCVCVCVLVDSLWCVEEEEVAFIPS